MAEGTPQARSERHRYASRLATPFLLVLALCACNVATPPRIASTGMAGDHAIAFVRPEGAVGLRANFAESLSDGLRDSGVTLSADGPLIADFSIAKRDAREGLADPAAQQEGVAVNWDSAPRNRRIFDRCSAERLRATLVLFDRTDGSVAWRGSGELEACTIGKAQVEAMANALVADMRASRTR